VKPPNLRLPPARIIALLALLLRPAHAAPAPDALHQRLAAARLPLAIGTTNPSGPGWQLILSAIAATRLVAIGEDHLSTEIPAFAGAVCDALGPSLAAMAVEAGPTAAALAADHLRAPNPAADMAALTARYPDSVAFLNSAPENALLSRCARAAGPRFQLWGLDQEFLGAAGRLLDAALAQPLRPPARAALATLRRQEQQDAAAAAQSGDPTQLFTFQANDTQLTEATRLVRQGGTPEAQRVLALLTTTHRIYAANLAGDPQANLARAQLLKTNLATHLAALNFPAGQGKVLLKFGEWHLYRGYNPLAERDLGNALAEYADANGAASLHIAVLGAAGVHALYAGYRRPLRQQPFVMANDPQYRWIAAAVDEMEPTGWTVFDLRRLRDPEPAGIPTAWSRLIEGYDLLVMIPQLTPASPVQPAPAP
jgi:hypothetical protein